jgi:arylsulfatase A-like enzyme
MQPEKKQKEFDMKPKTRSIAVAISVILIAVAFKAVPAMAQEITGAPSTFGGVIPTPALDRIANSGLRYTQFHSTSLCSPTRAALITGRNHHAAGYGVVGEAATGFPGYDSIIKKDTGTIGTILKDNGYATSWFGKDHNTPFYQSSQAGPFDQWPTGMGFDYFYGFVGGDNGASAEGMLNGTPNEFTTFNGVSVPVKDQFLWYEFWGSERTFPHFAAGWSWAMDTPFKWTKQVASHFGGTAQGLCMSWPGHIKDEGGIRRQFHHIIDIVPTILEATGIAAPDTINGIKQRAIEGVSMVYTWDKANAKAPTRHTTQYFEMLGNRAIYHDGWVAATTPVTLPWKLNTAQPPDVITGYKWELYNINEDVTEFNDLAAKNTMEHTTPIIFPEDEDFDVGQDTRTGVAMLEYRYDTPFKFTGKINRLTFDLGPVQYTQADRQQLPAIAHRVALTKD